MVCPDPECQKLLNMQLQTEKEKREMLAVQKQKQAQDRIDEKNNRW